MRRSLLLAAAFGFGASLYLPSLSHGFVWDDRSLIAENRFIRDSREWSRNLSSDFFRRSGESVTIGHWRPLVTASYMVDWRLGGETPRAFHSTNAALHGAATALLFLLAVSLGIGDAAALAAALVFAVQPAHVEAVSWISGRTDLLCGVFVLVALVLDARSAGGAVRALRLGAAAATLAALLAKEMAVVVPFAVALRANWIRRNGHDDASAALTMWRASWPHLVALALYAVVRLGVLGISPQAPHAAGAGRVALFWTWWSAFLDYARVVVWPWELSIVARVALATSPWSPRVVLGAVAFSAIAALAWRLRRVAPVVAWGLACSLASFAPLVNFVVPVRAISSVVFPWAERFLFVPTIFLAVAGAGLIGAWTSRARRGGMIGATVTALIVLALGARTLARERVWHSQLTLFAATVRTTPEHVPSLVALGAAQLDAGDLVGAEGRFRHALELAPEDAFAQFNLGNLLRQRGDLDGAEAAYRAAVASRPRYAQALLNLGLVEAARGRLDEAERSFRVADEALGGYPEAKVNLAIVMRLRGRPIDAKALYEQALALDPTFAPARAGLQALEGSGPHPE